MNINLNLFTTISLKGDLSKIIIIIIKGFTLTGMNICNLWGFFYM